MSVPLDDIASYSAFVYALAGRHPFVTNSTLALVPIGATLAKLEGRIECNGGIHLEVWELIDFATKRIRTSDQKVAGSSPSGCTIHYRQVAFCIETTNALVSVLACKLK